MEIGYMFYLIRTLIAVLASSILVSGLQQFVERPQDVSVIQGQTAVLRCAVENLVGHIQWAKNGLMLGYNRNIPGFSRYSIIGSSDEFNLQIIGATLDDDTVYQCQVSPADNEPPLLAEARLTVLVPPNMPEIIGHPNGSVVAVTFTQAVLQLKCVAFNGRPAATIKWYRNGELITNNVTYVTEANENDKRENAYNELTLYPKYPKDNKVKYECQAHNDALISGPLSVMVELSVQFPPGQPQITGYNRNQTVHPNNTIHMVCTSEGGNPLAQVVWYRDNERLDSSYTQKRNKATNELTFQAKRSDNNAQFRCEAWNVVNQDSPHVATRKLLVYFAPKSVTITGTREAKAGENLTLTCITTNSNPAAVINWIGSSIVKEDSRTDPSTDGGFITISVIVVTLTSDMTRAVFTCSASNNKLGARVSDIATVGVLYPPDPPKIFGYTEGAPVDVGSLLRMTCRATGGNPPATLTWYKGEEVLPAKNMSIGNIPSFEITVMLKADDNGALYKCSATNRATDVPLTTVTKVTVLFPPAYVRITSEPPRARAGKPLRLTCISASSNPGAIITWLHNDIPIQGTDMGMTNAENGGKSATNVLEIIPTAADHNAANYNCRANNVALNEHQTINDAITLNVLFKPLFEDLDTRIVIVQGQSRDIPFTAKANPPNATYILKRGNVHVMDGGTFMMDGGVLKISSISKNDQGLYTIEATNTEGTTQFNFTIDVHYPAEIIDFTPGEGTLGQDVELKCVVQGNPMVPNMVTWSRPGFDMTRTFSTYENGKSVLRVENLQKTDTGSFVCTADNQIATPAVSHIPLTVTFSPKIQKSPEHTKAASEMGGTGTLICRAEGYPKIEFTWMKDGVILTSGDKYYIEQSAKPENSIVDEGLLLILEVQRSDYGIYQCIVSNTKGNDSVSIHFKDNTKPDAPYGIEFVNATYNSITIKWQPGFSGGPSQKYRVRYKRVDSDYGYTYVDVDPPESTIFTVKGLALATEYELTVMAFNKLGGSEYQLVVVQGTTTNLKPTSVEGSPNVESGEDTPVIIILVICVVGIFLLALNIGLILFFVRKRRKRMENGSDTTSHTNTIELYGPSKETALYPMTPSDESRSYGTCDKNDDDFSDDYKSYEHDQHEHRHSPGTECVCLKIGKPTSWKDNCCFDPGDDDIKRVFLPPPEYGTVTYSHNKLDSPTFDHRLPIHSTEPKHLYNGSDRSDTDSCRKSPWQYDDPYRGGGYRSKGTFDSDCLDDSGPSMSYHEYNGKAGGGRPDIRPKSITELSERSSRPSSRGGYKTPPPPPVRSSSKGAAENIPPLPARNYGSPDSEPRYVPPPGTLSSFSNNVNVITNPTYDGPNMRSPSPGQPTDPTDDMRGHLV